MKTRTAASTPRSAGITLTEILISILILGVGLVSLATLFPIGLLRLREAQRQTRSAYLFESATADTAARGLLNANSFTYADLLNPLVPWSYWYVQPSGRYDPLTQDTALYGHDPLTPPTTFPGPGANNSFLGGGYGLPFAYDPLWRYQTVNPATGNQGIYLDPSLQSGTPEARFASGIYSLRPEGDGFPASAHGLQRLTNFNTPGVMPSANWVPNIFVSPEDVVWQESTNPNYTVAFSVTAAQPGGIPVGTPSTVVPDLSITYNTTPTPATPTYQPISDWRFSWMLTAQQTNGSNGASFAGNIVVFENRQFAYDPTTNQAAGETVVEAIFGAGKSLVKSPNMPSYYYAAGSDRTVLLRWPAVAVGNIPNSPQSDPVVKVGDWIADVTYERAQNQVNTRFYFNTATPTPPLQGAQNPLNKLEWDNLPAQRCFWYQVQKVTPAQADPAMGTLGYRSMTVYVNQMLDAKTLLDRNGNPVYQNAALICPYVVNVIPQTFFVR